MDAGREPGPLTTRPFVHPGGTLYINADASGGSVTAEYLDASGKPLAGVAASTKITGDHLRQAVSFSRGTDSRLQGKTIRLRLSAVDARLYSFWYR